MNKLYKNELSHLYFTLEQTIIKRDKAVLPSDVRGYQELIDTTMERIEKQTKTIGVKKMNELVKLLDSKGWEYEFNGKVLYVVIGNEEYEVTEDNGLASEVIEIVKGW